jgi:murein DD-endopeptidase MepM/ murein hydrolase activator NlpD
MQTKNLVIMRHLFIILTTLLISTAMPAQTEKPSYKPVADKFETNYNNNNYDSIFAQFSPGMQDALPIDKTIQFLQELKAQAGQITKRQFIKYEQTYASYKTNFERALYAINISVDNTGKINGLFVKAFTDDKLPKMERNITSLRLPFRGEWTVVWGGDTKELNYHVESIAQKNAFDIVITGNNGKTYRSDGKTNDDYYAFGQELRAPCDGEIVLVVDGVKDNVPGTLNPVYIPGNTVVIKTTNNEFILFAHFKQHSIQVKEGQKIKQGELLGLCGNSGNSSEPHLHFHIQNTEDMNVATGIKCFFDKVIVNGESKNNYSPIKGDKIKSE